jgi:WD40 repeat protein
VITHTTLPTEPYVGLMPYREEDAAFFFGREAERDIIIANLMASRLTLLYGPSGVGKTSVLHAGVAHHLAQQSLSNASGGGKPEYAVLVFGSWRDDPVSELLTRVGEAVVRTVGHPIKHPGLSRSLESGLRAWTERLGGDLLIILDQFEEFFVYHEGKEVEGGWAEELPSAVTQPDLRVNFLISIREDGLARLDQFKGRIPNLFANYLRVEHLDFEAAREAIEQPLAEFNRVCLPPKARHIAIEPALVDAVLEQVQTGQVLAVQGGLGTAGGTSSGSAGPSRIEAPYLQLVMTRLWDEEMAARSRVLRLETLERLGGAERIVRTHLDKALSRLPDEQQTVAASAFRYLVTPSGTKITHTLPDLAEYAGVTPGELDPVLQALSDPSVRVLRPVAPPPNQPATPRYEIFHDVLAAPILDWWTRYESAEKAKRLEREKTEAQEEARSERRRARKFRSLSLALILLTALTVLAIVVALTERSTAQRQRGEARRQTRLAESEALRAVAALATPIDPRVAMVRSVQAEKIRPGPIEPERLARALSLLRASLESINPLPDATFSSDGTRVATVDVNGTAVLWNSVTGERIAVLANNVPVSSIAFSPDNRLLATGDVDGFLRIWSSSEGEPMGELQSQGTLLSVSFSGDSEKVLTAGVLDGGTIWGVSQGTPSSFGEFTDHVFDASFLSTSDRFMTVSSSTGRVDITFIQGLRRTSGGGVGGVESGESWQPLDAMVGSAGKLLGVTMTPPNNVVGLWQIREKRLSLPSGRIDLVPKLRRVATLRGHSAPLTSAAFTKGASRVVTSSVDGTARIWDATTGEALHILEGHIGPVMGANFDPSGGRVVTAGADGTVRLWDASSGEQLRVLHVTASGVVISAAFSPDGSTILTDTADGLAQLWNTDSGKLGFTLDD